MDTVNITNRVLEIESFVNDVLKPELNDVCQKLDETNSEIMEYMQLKNTIEMFQKMRSVKEPFKSMTDIGCSFYMETRSDDLSKILINISDEYFVEFTLEEALKYVVKRIDLLQIKTEHLRDESADVKSHMKLILSNMQQLPDDNDDNAKTS